MHIICAHISPSTEIIVEKVGAVFEIQPFGKCNSNTLNGIFCIAPGGSNEECYNFREDEMRLNESNYTYTGCSNASSSLNANSSKPFCLTTTVRQAMNNTLYTGICCRTQCRISAIPYVGATLKLIVAGKEKRPDF